MTSGESVFPIAPGTFLRSGVTRLIFAVALALEIAIMGLFMADVISASVARKIGISVAALSVPMLINVWIHLHGRLSSPKELRYYAKDPPRMLEDVVSVQADLETDQPEPVGSVEISCAVGRNPDHKSRESPNARIWHPLLLSRATGPYSDPDQFVAPIDKLRTGDKPRQ